MFLARSVLDGYTPQSIGDALQVRLVNRIFNLVHENKLKLTLFICTQEKVLDALRTIQLLGPLRVLAHYLALEEEELGGE